LTHCYDELAPDLPTQAGIPAICWRDEEGGLFEPFQLREETEYLVDLILPISPERAEERWRDDAGWPLPARLSGFYRTDPPKRWRDMGGQVQITGRLNLGAHVGIVDLTPEGASRLIAEVVPRKIGYFADFRALLELIADELVDLIIEIDGPTAARFTLSDSNVVDPRILVFHLRRLMSEGRLPSAVASIMQRPHSMMSIREQLVPPGEARLLAPDRLLPKLASLDMQEGGTLGRLFGGFTPNAIPETSRRDTLDTRENRYVKSFLEDLLLGAEALTRRLEAAGFGVSAKETRRWCSTISEWLDEPMWRDVGVMFSFPSNSQVLQRVEGYRDVLAADLDLQFGIKLPWPRALGIAEGLDGDIRPIDELYEYWCFFVLRSVLRSICGAEISRNDSTIRRSEDGLVVDLQRGRQSRTEFAYQEPGGRVSRVSLFYNRAFPRRESAGGEWTGSYSALFKPDYSILVEVLNTEGRVTIHWLHFDAKYRLELREWQTAIVGETETVEREITLGLLQETYRRENLDDMHSYRDALLGSRGAYVLFPGSGNQEDIFVRYPGATYPGGPYQIPSVGAFQLRPHSDAQQAEHLRRFVAAAMERLVRPVPYAEERGFF